MEIRNNVTSFKIDHNNLPRGIYVSRIDKRSDITVTTFDIRIKEPNKEMVLDTAVIHSLEHLMAVYLRDCNIKDDILYVGPMGCRTGMYVLLFGEWSPMEFAPYLIETFKFITDYEGEVAAAKPEECGNYSDHNLEITKIESKIYLEEVLLNLSENNTIY